MMLPVVLCAALAATAFGNDAANDLMDNVLTKMMGELHTARLDPVAVTPFMLSVKGSGQEVKARFLKGSLKGLIMLERQGDCSVRNAGQETVIGCFISLSPLSFSMNGEVKGDQPKGEAHSISTSTAVAPNSMILIELKGMNTFNVKAARVTTRPVTMKTSLAQGKVDLKSERLNEFIKNIHDNLAQQLESTLKGPFSTVLNRIAGNYLMP